MRQRSHNTGSIKEIKHTNPTLNPRDVPSTDYREDVTSVLLPKRLRRECSLCQGLFREKHWKLSNLANLVYADVS